MNENRTITIRRGGSVFVTVGCVFVALKLTHVIDWSWVWVLAPFWVGLAFWAGVGVIFLLVLLVAGGVAALADAAETRRNRKRKALWIEKDERWANRKLEEK